MDIIVANVALHYIARPKTIKSLPLVSRHCTIQLRRSLHCGKVTRSHHLLWNQSRIMKHQWPFITQKA